VGQGSSRASHQAGARIGDGKGAAFVASWTVGWAFGITVMVILIDAVLFALYYRAVVDNANEVIAVQGVDSANTLPS
jgi:hypothetical protein